MKLPTVRLYTVAVPAAAPHNNLARRYINVFALHKLSEKSFNLEKKASNFEIRTFHCDFLLFCDVSMRDSLALTPTGLGQVWRTADRVLAMSAIAPS